MASKANSIRLMACIISLSLFSHIYAASKASGPVLIEVRKKSTSEPPLPLKHPAHRRTLSAMEKQTNADQLEKNILFIINQNIARLIDDSQIQDYFNGLEEKPLYDNVLKRYLTTIENNKEKAIAFWQAVKNKAIAEQQKQQALAQQKKLAEQNKKTKHDCVLQ